MTYLQVGFPGLLALCAAAMLWHARTQSVRSRRCFWVVFFALVLFCWPPVAWLVSGTLEWRYSNSPTPNGGADAVVVLGGSASWTDGVSPVWIPAPDTYVRCRHAAWLHRQFPELPIVVCGADRAAAMKDLLVDEGVPPDLIIEENESTSTYENAGHAAELLEERGIGRVFLVTEAHHMLRAQLCFQRQELSVIPAACGFRAQVFDARPGMFLPGATAIRHNEEAMHEWVGLSWYWVKGRI